MTGPCEGKILLDSAAFLNENEIDCKVYIHKKGFAGATVTHLDIESPRLNLLDSRGGFFEIFGTGTGIEIFIRQKTVRLECHAIKSVLPSGKSTRTWVGQKQDGIYVGFRKEEMLKLESAADALV